MERQVFLPLSGASFISQLSLLLLLTGCATTGGALSSANQPEASAGKVQIAWLRPNRAQIRLDDKRYVGEWSESRCFTQECRGKFWNIEKVHRQHIRKGVAELVAKDNTRLNCEWVSHNQEVIGACRTDDGRIYRLQAG